MKLPSCRPLAFLCVLVSLILRPLSSSGQVPIREPCLIAALRAGQFRVSLDRFEEIYASRWGLCYGGDAAVRVWGNMYAFAGGRWFESEGREQGEVPSEVAAHQAYWHERWLLVGMRRWSFGERKWSSAVGLGYAFFWVEENPKRAVLKVPAGGGGEQAGRGFFLTVTLDYSLRPWLGMSAEVEVTSAGVGGRTGFEGSSIGGFFFSLGVNLRPR